MKLEFNVENQYITMPVRRTVVADSVEYLEAMFVFTHDWDECKKTAVFKQGEDAYAVLLEENCCMIPCEVIKEGCFSVSVFGIDGNTRITTNEVYVTVQKSGYTEGETPKGPTPDAYSQLLNDMETEITERKAADEELTNQLSGKVDKIEGKGLSSNDYTDADKEEIANLNKTLESETKARIEMDDELTTSISQINMALDTKLEYKGRLSGVDLATITERGIYYVNFDCTNLPDSFADYFPNSSAFLLVLPYGTDDEGKGISLTQVIFGLTTTLEGPGGNLITPYPYDTADMYARNIYYHEAYGAAIDQSWTKINDFKKYFEKYLHNEYVNKTDSYTAQYDNGDGSYEIGSSYTFQDIVNAIDSLGSYAKKSDVDEQIGSIETALDEIIAIQNTLMGDAEGDTVSSGEIANEL